MVYFGFSNKLLATFLFGVLFLAHCTSEARIGYELIHAPVDLQVVRINDAFTGYEISFFSDNQETNFAGYRIYQGSSAEEAENQQVIQFNRNRSFAPMVTIDASSPTGWCISSLPFRIDLAIRIQIGGTVRLPEYNCMINEMRLVPGNYVAVRSGVNRDCTQTEDDDCFPWSRAAKKRIP